MKPVTREWVMKAEEDFLSAVDLARRRKRPVWNAVCFHCQQAAEKYLKARMHEAGLTVRRTHDLDALLNDLLSIEPLWAAFRPALQDLSDFAVDFRYPGKPRDEIAGAPSPFGLQSHSEGRAPQP